MSKKNKNRENKQEQNKIILAGVVISIFRKKKMLKLRISTSPSRNKNYRSTPEIVCFDSTAANVDLKIGDHVEIEGAMLTVPFSKRRSENASYIVASKVTKAVSSLAYNLGVSGISSSYDDKNEVIIAGKVINVHVFPDNERAFVTVKARANGRISLPSVACFNPTVQYILDNGIAKGDTIAFSGYISTKYNEKKETFFETIVARDVALIEKASQDINDDSEDSDVSDEQETLIDAFDDEDE